MLNRSRFQAKLVLIFIDVLLGFAIAVFENKISELVKISPLRLSLLAGLTLAGLIAANVTLLLYDSEVLPDSENKRSWRSILRITGIVAFILAYAWLIFASDTLPQLLMVIAFVVAILSLLVIIGSIFIKAQPSDRTKMLNNVYEYWIKGVLEKGKIDDVWLDLIASERPKAVVPAISRTVQHRGVDSFRLETGTQIADVFRRTGRALLILGEPGSGKTMTLLELAKHLILEAKADDLKPMPVVLNLASWAEEHPERLEKWLIERLFLDYGVSRKLSAYWIASGNLLFLFDGLDEVAESQRLACLTAINKFWSSEHDWKDNGIAVCSRVEEYNMLSEQLHLEDAVILNPLTPEQADNYLEQLGEKWADLRAVVETDPVLRELATSPLLLNIMAVAYRDTLKEEITGFASVEDQQKHLFDFYVARRLGEATTYPNFTACRYLAWLTRHMITHNQTVFLIEGLQPEWLDTERQHQRFRIIGLLVVMLLGGLLCGLVVMLVGGLVYGLVGGMNTWIQIKEKLNWSWSKALRGLVSGLFYGLLGGLFYGLLGGLSNGLVYGLLFGLVVMLIAGLVGGLFGALRGGLDTTRVEQLNRPNGGIRRSLISGLVFGLFGGLLGGLFGGLVFRLIYGGLVFGLFGGLLSGLNYGGGIVLQYTILRVMFYRAGVAPLNYAKFLQYTSDRHLTRQVGGLFVFRHRMLMEHFARSKW
ncbi:MAG: NACHT domain-containing protein [Chloroflexota bacterium]